MYGSLFVAPTLYGWVRLAGRIWPNTNVRTAITKACIEQLTYGPAAIASFFLAMTYLETKSVQLAKEELAEKFLPTWKVEINLIIFVLSC